MGNYRVPGTAIELVINLIVHFCKSSVSYIRDGGGMIVVFFFS